MWQFAEACRGLKDACLQLGIPVTGGNVSLYNQTGETPILPTPVVAVLGVIEDVTRRTPSAWSAAGERVFLLGETREELSGSEWAHVVHGHLGGLPPKVDLEAERSLAQLLHAGVGLLSSAHDLSDGGLAQALVEGALRHDVGVAVTLPGDAFVGLFSESAARVLVTVPDGGADRLVELAGQAACRDHRARGHRRRRRSSVDGRVRRAPRRAARDLDGDPAGRAGLRPVRAGPRRRTPGVRRRTLLSLPALCGLVALTGCAEEEVRPVSTSGPRTVVLRRRPVAVRRADAPVPATRAGSRCWSTAASGSPQYGIEYATPMVPSLVAAGWATWAIEYRRGTGSADTLADVRAAIDALAGRRRGPLRRRRHRALRGRSPGHLGRRARRAHPRDLPGRRARPGVGVRRGPRRRSGGGVPRPPAGSGRRRVSTRSSRCRSTCRSGACTATSDQFVPLEQSRAYVAAATAAGADAELVEVEGDHFVVIDPDSDAWATTLAHLETLA